MLVIGGKTGVILGVSWRGASFRACVLLAAAAVVFAAFATAGTSRASAQPAPVVVAEVPLHQHNGGILGVFTEVQLLLCIANDFTTCFGHPLETITFSINVTNVGSTIWIDATSPTFENFVAQITDGAVDLVEELETPDGVTGVLFGAPEPLWFGADVGPSGVDLSGYEIHRIGVRIDAVSFSSPGSDPNGDGNWTDFTVQGAFIFEGTVICTNDVWQVHGIFKNQGDCVSYVATGGANQPG
jgi:hypothetical protein